MRHVQKVMIALALVIVFVFGLTGCGKTIGDMDLEEGQSAIYIQEDGKVSYAVSEKFDKDYYDEDKLEDTINEEVENYNEGSKASIKNAITVDTFKVKSDTATLVLEFATAYDFLTYITGYNNIDKSQFYVGYLADNSDCKIKGDFMSPDKKEKLSAKEIKKLEDVNILIVNDSYRVQIDKDVKYMSTNCSVDEDGIITTGKAGEDLSYIIY